MNEQEKRSISVGTGSCIPVYFVFLTEAVPFFGVYFVSLHVFLRRGRLQLSETCGLHVTDMVHFHMLLYYKVQ